MGQRLTNGRLSITFQLVVEQLYRLMVSSAAAGGVVRALAQPIMGRDRR
jgi:hypothetical protein